MKALDPLPVCIMDFVPLPTLYHATLIAPGCLVLYSLLSYWLQRGRSDVWKLERPVGGDQFNILDVGCLSLISRAPAECSLAMGTREVGMGDHLV